MQINKRSALWSLPFGAVLLSLAMAGPAHAATVPIDSDQPVLSSTLTITNSQGASTTSSSTGTLQSVQDVTPADSADAAEPAQAADAGASQAATSSAVAGPKGAKLLCNKFYKYSDSNVSYTVQHQCGGKTIPWGIKLSPALCAAATSNVTEAGQIWARNGKTQPKQAGHNVVCSYQFHGNYSNSPDGTHIAYSDVLTWRVAGDGTATLQVYGSFTATGNRCGSATSC
ncbi:hypothetical protein QF011_003450 [Curtobacterium flaccumfaciens]|nr:hypothetical protein [Curtobacterium flaccumfaciens]MDQ0540872.1 hypothetical protein [Curtobacterium flaccumfaciens]